MISTPHDLTSCCSRPDTFNTCLSPHSAGHTLDLVIIKSDVVVTNLYVGTMISDHALISFKLRMMRSVEVNVQTVTSRAWRRLSRDAFASDLAASRLCSDLNALKDMSVDDLAKLYRDVMTNLFDRHADCRAGRRRAETEEIQKTAATIGGSGSRC